MSSYDLRDGRKLSLTNKAAGGWDLWFTLGNGKTRFDTRVANELALYGTTVIERDTGSDATFGREASLNYRGGVLIGLRHEPNERFALGFWAGTGIQYAVHTPMVLKAGMGSNGAHACSSTRRSRASLEWCRA